MIRSRRVLCAALTLPLFVAALGGCQERPVRVAPVVESSRGRPESLRLAATAVDGRLSNAVTPDRYSLSLRIDPEEPRFSGTVVIDVTVREASSVVVLHARDMTIRRAVVRAGGAETTATVSSRRAAASVEPEELILGLPRRLEPGNAQIEIAYDGPFASDLAGLYRVEEGGRHYAYTQFEVADARRAFPCFDEPGYKTPFDVTLTAPRSVMALTNSPEMSRIDADDGAVVHHFAVSPPLPTYLVAFAVGDFDTVEWQREPFPIRAVATKGRGQLTSMALGTAAAMVAEIADYLAVPYPYAKLDLVAVPDFAAGAMENPGLLTFRDSLLLLDPRRATAAARRSQALVLAHELAHQWFGDLVTMKWWDDIWLNEGFATWAEAKVVDLWKPSFGGVLEQIAGVQGVMDVDALSSARAVRQPVRSKSDAEEAFDGITYEKGAAVLRMLESWLGPDVFRRGLQRYLRENAWKNADAADLFRALDYVSTQNVAALAGGFLDQPGVPEVLVHWGCEGPHGSKLELSESEWRPLGSAPPPTRGWTLPVCIATDAQKGKSCFTLGHEWISRDLGPTCPTWVHPNEDGAGYYRFVLDGAHLMSLARGAKTLSPVDRLEVVSNAWAEVRQGVLSPGVIFDILPAFDGEMNQYVVDQIAGTLAGVGDVVTDADTKDAFQRWVAARMATRKAALGWEAGPYEEDDRAALRATVLWTLGDLANDGPTLDEAERYASRWLSDPSSVPGEIAALAVPLASIRAGAARLSELRSAATQAKTPEDRVLVVRAMGLFDDPLVLRKALDLSLTGELKLSELRYLFGSAVAHRSARKVLYAWEKEKWSELKARLPGSLGRGMLVDVVGTICTAEERDDARAFFGQALRGVEAVQRHLDEALEGASLCIALRERDAAEVTRRLKPR